MDSFVAASLTVLILGFMAYMIVWCNLSIPIITCYAPARIFTIIRLARIALWIVFTLIEREVWRQVHFPITLPSFSEFILPIVFSRLMHDSRLFFLAQMAWKVSLFDYSFHYRILKIIYEVSLLFNLRLTYNGLIF